MEPSDELAEALSRLSRVRLPANASQDEAAQGLTIIGAKCYETAEIDAAANRAGYGKATDGFDAFIAPVYKRRAEIVAGDVSELTPRACDVPIIAPPQAPARPQMTCRWIFDRLYCN